jgi:hypothetical protein
MTMGIYAIRVPDIGEGIAEVELVVWHVQPGDMVAEDQSIADVMTDKATVEIPRPSRARWWLWAAPWATPLPWAPSWCGWKWKAPEI